ncbi:molybdopterin molybdotransferase MoeA [Sulfuriroseicoccus oceanibius]|uniref:Molybdopterin molybdenumtransferase n=1 Tax=Sulfuriroseicoccus oceanibius TaxID=2707525 RepID=A0A6B3LD35_9BACT|nr:molybdopterin molybdotransferase MoeA [Sulfuriroseicoccus oceanibius]QQL44851.1 molybdopterin molybdotransferase MoeA [Sulfuriroseicoccus oceanibius]
MHALISIDEADDQLQHWVERWREAAIERDESVPLAKAMGRRLAQAVAADRPLPPYDRVMMDGVVVRADDWRSGLREFQLVWTQAAGAAPRAGVPSGCAVEVMTGAVCPLAPAEAVVVPVERLVGGIPAAGGLVVADAGSVADLEPGRFVHPCGADAAAGATLLDVGAMVGPSELGILASCGIENVRVARQIRVAVVSTGDELVAVGDQPEAHQIRRSNDVVISGFATKHGAKLIRCDHVADERAELVSLVAMLDGLADVVLFSGGVSMGRRDHVPSVLGDRCGEPLFHGVRQRPGKPFGVWDGGSTLFCALPGNPVSVLACLCRHVGPLLAAMSGAPAAVATCELDAPIAPLPDFGLLKPVAAVAEDRVAPLVMRNSGDFAGIGGLAGFVELPAAGESVAAGTRLHFYPC